MSLKIFLFVGIGSLIIFIIHQVFFKGNYVQKTWKSATYCALFSIGATLIFFEGQSIDRFIEIRNWPTTEGKIISSKVAGERAFHPEIGYEYSIAGKTYTGVTDMEMPGFGSRAYRKSNSEKIIFDYPQGIAMKIHYDPENPSVSKIHTSAHYSVYLLITIGALFYGTGIFGILQAVKNRFFTNKVSPLQTI